MGTSKLSRTEALAQMSTGLHCSQCTLAQWADELGYDVQELHNMAAAFGGGMFRGDTCGAVTGALIAIGLGFGGARPGDDSVIRKKVRQFQEDFTARFGSTICREIVGYDFSVPGDHEKALESGRLVDLCPDVVVGALEILDDIMQDLP